jgi:predicted ATPase/class 3 adenylate cyclase
VTFLFCDIEGSTRLARDLGADRWAALLADHDHLADDATNLHGGVVVKHEGDGFFAAFASADEAAAASVALARSLQGNAWPLGASVAVRMGIHTGDGRLAASGRDYVGIDVHYAARVTATANGGQIIVTDAARAMFEGRIPDGTSLVDEGLHRVKDFDDPRRLYRLVVPGIADDERPLRTIRSPTNLPEPASAFVGRTDEAREIGALVQAVRLVTLSGPGGAGKTRLAIEVASRLRTEFPDGLWFVDLAPIDDHARVPSAIATVIGIDEEAGLSIADSVAAALRDRRCLLILDNFEQVIAAAPLVTRLVTEARAVHVLVSSREPLRVSGEQIYVVTPLHADDAIALFVARARESRPDFGVTDASVPVIRAICDRLDHLPLAIELAAARIRVLSPDRILERLERSLDTLVGRGRDQPERQRTLRGAIAWSHDLLDPGERVIFRRLGTFAAGWTLDGATAVCDPDGDLDIPVEDGLISLVDKSLVAEEPTADGEPRFRMLATIGEFAREQLDLAGEREILGARHAAYVLSLAMEAAPVLDRGDPAAWLDRLGREVHEIRSALGWSLASGDVETGMLVAGAVWRFWQHRSLLREGLDWCDRLLARHDGEATVGRFRVLLAAAGLAYWQADHDESERRYVEANDVAERLDDDRMRAEARFGLGFIPMVRGDTERLRELHESSLRLYEKLDDRTGIMEVRQGLTVLAFLEGDWAAAHRMAELIADDHRATGALYRLADAESLLAAAGIGLGDLDDALVHLRKALTIERDLSLVVSMTGSLMIGAVIATAVGDHLRAASLIGAVEALKEEVGTRSSAAIDVLHLPDPAEEARRVLGDPAFETAVEAGRRLSLDDAIALAVESVTSSSTPRS